ncbi:MAG: hypothetical protein Q4G07_10415 [Oscillospiraceae bacterium]|nr:hypothetical protein [Oscillospiraceae bacterium]
MNVLTPYKQVAGVPFGLSPEEAEKLVGPPERRVFQKPFLKELRSNGSIFYYQDGRLVCMDFASLESIGGNETDLSMYTLARLIVRAQERREKQRPRHTKEDDFIMMAQQGMVIYLQKTTGNPCEGGVPTLRHRIAFYSKDVYLDVQIEHFLKAGMK